MGKMTGLMANNSSPKLSLNLRRVTFCQQKSYFNNPENLQTFMEVKLPDMCPKPNNILMRGFKCTRSQN